MASWDYILSHYTFDSKLYTESSDPRDLRNSFVDTIPEYPFPAFRPNQIRFLFESYDNILAPIIPSSETLLDFPFSVDVTYFNSESSGRQCIYFTKYQAFLNLYNHSDFVKMHIHNAWHFEKSDLTISLSTDFFTEPKFVYIFCGTMKLSDIYEDSDVNNFNFHTSLFASTYLMIDDAFIFKILQTSGDVNFRSNDTILPSLYALLNLNLDLSCTQSWFESHFPHYNTSFISGIRALPFHAFRRRFLNFKRHNERYQEHFYNNFLGRAHCLSTCDICTEHDRLSFSCIDQELSRFKNDYLGDTDSKFKPFAHDFEPSDQIFQTFSFPVKFHQCSSSCHIGSNIKQNFYSFTYKSMLIYAFYQNLTKSNKAMFSKCHEIHNILYQDAYQKLSLKLGPIYGTYHLKTVILPKLSVRELKMVIDNILPVGRDLDIDFQSYHGLIDQKLFFPVISPRNQLKYSNSFLT